VIEPLIEDLSAQSWFVTGKSKTGADTADRIAGGLSGAMVELEATLATTTMSMAELKSLEVGDMIVTHRPASSPAILGVEGRPKFFAQIGQYKGGRALKIQRPIKPHERIDLSGSGVH
jgi:flagellar motor switch protein FliM